MTSEKQLLANQRNAQRSTGPRSEEGKARSRLNATRHGLAGAGVGLPKEEVARVKERLSAWREQVGPRDDIEAYLLQSAVVASVRVDRCVRNEFATGEERRRETIRSWEEEEDEKLQALIPGIPSRTGEVLPQLLEFSTGCEWLMFQWESFRDGLHAIGHLDANNLAGAQALVHCEHAGDLEQLNALARQGGEGAEAARQQIEEMIETERDALKALRNKLWNQQEAPRVTQLLEETAFDDSPRAQLMRRYETACRNDLHRALREISRLRKENLLVTQPQPTALFPEPQPETAYFPAPASEGAPEEAPRAAFPNEAISPYSEIASTLPANTCVRTPVSPQALRVALSARRRRHRDVQSHRALAGAGVGGPAGT